MASELILIVEDNAKNRKLMRDVLQFKGYRLAEAETGEDGVRLARELHPDLILMDIQLPGISGITAFRQIRDDPATATIPVIAVTASAMTQDRKTIMAAGFEGYQSKPLSTLAGPGPSSLLVLVLLLEIGDHAGVGERGPDDVFSVITQRGSWRWPCGSRRRSR